MTTSSLARWGFSVVIVLTATASLASCAMTSLTPVADVGAPASSSPSAVPVAATPQMDLAPLRGTSVPAGTLNHASIAAKIDNHPDARPQVGLERTDLVFEELVEGGLTRYVAVWQSDIPNLIGPVRSIRPMDPDIISPLGGIVAYSGGQERFVKLMRKTPVYNAIHGQADTASTFYRGSQARAPHNVIVKAKELLAQHADLNEPAEQFNFAPTISIASAPTVGTPERVITYRFSSEMAGSWTWDGVSSKYLRQQGRGPDLDTNKAQLAATNVVIMRVPIDNSLGVPKTQIVGTGEAWISTGGATMHATWSKTSAASQILLIGDDGFMARLAPGNTWIELVPLEGSIDFAP